MVAPPPPLISRTHLVFLTLKTQSMPSPTTPHLLLVLQLYDEGRFMKDVETPTNYGRFYIIKMAQLQIISMI